MQAYAVMDYEGLGSLGVQTVIPVAGHLCPSDGYGQATAQLSSEIPQITGCWPEVEACLCFGHPMPQHMENFYAYCLGRSRVVLAQLNRGQVAQAQQLSEHAGYRTCAVRLNLKTFGLAQHRNLWFLISYQGTFNLEPPPRTPTYFTLWDSLQTLRHIEDLSWDSLTESEQAAAPHIPNGWSLEDLLRCGLLDGIPKDLRVQGTYPQLHRLTWRSLAPPIHSKLLHPDRDTPLSLGELATLQGWSFLPQGDHPTQQIVHSTPPVVAAWLASQVRLHLRGHWGEKDWESSYCPVKEAWKGKNTARKQHKTYDVSAYYGDCPFTGNYPEEAKRRSHTLQRSACLL